MHRKLNETIGDTMGGSFKAGVAYYPEQWDKTLWKDDAIRMKKAGIEMVRIMEFAWCLIEPVEGKFDFSLFDEVVDILSKEGIKVVLGTPTATIPYWLFKKDPSCVQINNKGLPKQWGGRRSVCVNNPAYIEATIRLINAIADHYKDNTNIIGWQLDNEIGHEGSDRCFCKNCQQKWNIWLQNKYGSIDNLNNTWGTIFWGTTYHSFDIPLPLETYGAAHNPSMLLDYSRFMSDSFVNYLNIQYDILHSKINKDQWIATDVFMPSLSNNIDIRELTSLHDFIGLNNYPVWGDQDQPLPYYFTTLNMLYLKGLKDKSHFTVFEQFSSMQGHICLGYLPPEKQVISWTDKAVAFGAERLFYFRWRTAPFGQEQLCYGILNNDNSDTDLLKAISNNLIEKQEVYDRIASSSSIKPKSCIAYHKDSIRVLSHQYQTKALYYAMNDYLQVGFEFEFTRWYAPFSIFQIPVDVKPLEDLNLSDYKIISLPFYLLCDLEFVKKLENWVKGGGVLILSWRTGIRNKDNIAINLKLPGYFSKLAGINIDRFESLNNTKTHIKIGLFRFKVEAWADILNPVTAKVIARYSDKKKHYNGSAAITVNIFGKGKVYYIGTSPSTTGLLFLYHKIFRKEKMKPKFYGEGIESIDYMDKNKKTFKVIINNSNKKKRAFGKKLAPYSLKIKE